LLEFLGSVEEEHQHRHVGFVRLHRAYLLLGTVRLNMVVSL
jgi:hypothetical protein